VHGVTTPAGLPCGGIPGAPAAEQVLACESCGRAPARPIHEEVHGAPTSAALLERELVAGPFTFEDGRSVFVSQAFCSGDGEAEPGGYTHFRCRVTIPDGPDEVLVHVLERELFFTATRPASP
jgi:hypothetical protein